MRLAISNIAWDIAEDESVAELLRQYQVDAIDIAPSKYFPDPVFTSEKQTEDIRKWWAERDIEITGMQSLLFGTTGLNLFGSENTRKIMLSHLESICRLGSALGATRLVFGSPKNRDRTGLKDQQVADIAIRFFRDLGDIAKKHGVIICLEPNPVCYGANFMTTSSETAEVVRTVNHNAIRMQLDIGSLTINEESADFVVSLNAPLIGHIHASEPDLAPLGDRTANHASAAIAVKRYLPDHLVSIEMVATQHEGHLMAIERALSVAVLHYRNV